MGAQPHARLRRRRSCIAARLAISAARRITSAGVCGGVTWARKSASGCMALPFPPARGASSRCGLRAPDDLRQCGAIRRNRNESPHDPSRSCRHHHRRLVGRRPVERQVAGGSRLAVVMACRDLAKAEARRASKPASRRQRARLLHIDLGSMASVRGFVDAFHGLGLRARCAAAQRRRLSAAPRPSRCAPPKAMKSASPPIISGISCSPTC